MPVRKVDKSYRPKVHPKPVRAHDYFKEPDAITYSMAAKILDRIEAIERRLTALEDDRI